MLCRICSAIFISFPTLSSWVSTHYHLLKTAFYETTSYEDWLKKVTLLNHVRLQFFSIFFCEIQWNSDGGILLLLKTIKVYVSINYNRLEIQSLHCTSSTF